MPILSTPVAVLTHKTQNPPGAQGSGGGLFDLVERERSRAASVTPDPRYPLLSKWARAERGHGMKALSSDDVKGELGLPQEVSNVLCTLGPTDVTLT